MRTDESNDRSPGVRMADDDRDTAVERARLEGIAWGAGSSEAEAARARIALGDLQRGRGVRASVPDATRVVQAEPRDQADTSLQAGRGHLPERVPDDGDDLPDRVPVDGPAPGDVGDQEAAQTQAPGRPWTRPLRLARWALARPWVAGGVAAVVVVAFGTGLAIGTAHPVTPSSPSVTPTAGSVTLEQLLDAPQTYADQLPGAFEAPVSLHTTRLVFTNRSLSGDDAATPWAVWAGVGTDRATICLVATADRRHATSACYPRQDALHGSVSLSASSLSGTLTVDLRGGGVRGTVTNEF
ncbi:MULTISPECIES: hypothetical protein [unclassified Curtobacterium]|uniref:hypothetical protein n=1 Tax=unclassified Curtobacterium TaxID=257496 RepID=UPI00226B6C89|nr:MULTISPECIES: hypothetical protein [unclassified Curtobacterium]